MRTTIVPVLCLSLTLSLFGGCGGEEADEEQNRDQSSSETPRLSPESLPIEPVCAAKEKDFSAVKAKARIVTMDELQKRYVDRNLSVVTVTKTGLGGLFLWGSTTCSLDLVRVFKEREAPNGATKEETNAVKAWNDRVDDSASDLHKAEAERKPLYKLNVTTDVIALRALAVGGNNLSIQIFKEGNLTPIYEHKSSAEYINPDDPDAEGDLAAKTLKVDLTRGTYYLAVGLSELHAWTGGLESFKGPIEFSNSYTLYLWQGAKLGNSCPAGNSLSLSDTTTLVEDTDWDHLVSSWSSDYLVNPSFVLKDGKMVLGRMSKEWFRFSDFLKGKINGRTICWYSNLGEPMLCTYQANTADNGKGVEIEVIDCEGKTMGKLVKKWESQDKTQNVYSIQKMRNGVLETIGYSQKRVDDASGTQIVITGTDGGEINKGTPVATLTRTNIKKNDSWSISTGSNRTVSVDPMFFLTIPASKTAQDNARQQACMNGDLWDHADQRECNTCCTAAKAASGRVAIIEYWETEQVYTCTCLTTVSDGNGGFRTDLTCCYQYVTVEKQRSGCVCE